MVQLIIALIDPNIENGHLYTHFRDDANNISIHLNSQNRLDEIMAQL